MAQPTNNLNQTPIRQLRVIAEEARQIRKNIEGIMRDFEEESDRLEQALSDSEKNINAITHELDTLDQEIETKTDALILEEAEELGKE